MIKLFLHKTRLMSSVSVLSVLLGGCSWIPFFGEEEKSSNDNASAVATFDASGLSKRVEDFPSARVSAGADEVRRNLGTFVSRVFRLLVGKIIRMLRLGVIPIAPW